MKFLFSLLAILMLNKECDSKKTNDTALNDKSNIVQENVAISYEASTRGFYEKIWITKDSITVSGDRNHVEKVSSATSLTDWNELMAILKEVNVEDLPTLEAPTSLRHHDGAAFATLAVTENNLEITSNSFDHGYPPKAIETLVNKVLSMNKLRKKQ